MAWVAANSAAFRLTGFAQAANSYLGKIRSMFEYIITDEVIQIDGDNFPSARPVDNLDMRQTIEMLDMTSFLPNTTAAANTVTTATEAGAGGSAVLTAGAMVCRSVRHGVLRRNGGNPMSQDFYLQGTPTFTTTM